MEILTNKYFKKYKKNLINFDKKIEKFINNSKEFDFDYLTDASSVYSSNIE